MSLFLTFFLIFLVFVRDTAQVKTNSLDTGPFTLIYTFRSFMRPRKGVGEDEPTFLKQIF